jgi:ferredoxin-NAD(P)+ reductase (naphthalene dioxygenase ferredoxin-specific)
MGTPDALFGDASELDLHEVPQLRECLACQTPVAADSLVEIPDSDDPVVLPARTLKGVVKAVEFVASGVARLRLRVDSPLRYLGGQHFEVSFRCKAKRFYSAIVSDDTGELAFDIQIHPYGTVSQFISEKIEAGETVRIRGPLGNAYLRRKDSSRLILISSGTGLGSMLTLVRDIAEAGMSNPVQIYAGFGFSEQVYGRAELARSVAALPGARRCEVVVASGPLQKGDRRGLLTDAVLKDLELVPRSTAYLFGTQSAIEFTARSLRLRGMKPRCMHAVPFECSTETLSLNSRSVGDTGEAGI